MQKTVKELVKILKRILDAKNLFVIYHFDIDGCASASILWRIFQKEKINAEFYPVTRGFEGVAMEKISKSNPDKIVLLDYVPDDIFINFLKDYKTEIIDHHSFEEKLAVFEYFTSAKYEIGASLSYLMHKAAGKFFIKDTEWLARLGSFWDKCMEHTEFYYDGVYQKEMEEMLPFNLVVNLTHVSGSEKIFELMNSHRDFENAIEDVRKLTEFKRAEQIFKSELREIEFSKKAYPDLKLSIYWVKTRFKHIRIYVDYITYQSTGTQVFILNEISRFKFSLRTSLDINLVELINRLKKKFPNFGGGGHKHACGALLLGENVEELLAEFINEYSNMLGLKTFKPAF